MQSIALGIMTLFIFNGWVWFISQLISSHTKKTAIITSSLFAGFATSIIMLAYHPLLWLIQHIQWWFFETIQTQSYITFPIYIVATIFAIYSIWQKIQQKEGYHVLLFLIVWIVLMTVINIGEPSYILLYYGFIAWGEEFLKYFWGLSLFKNYHIHSRDIIIFALLSALSFAMVENIRYIISSQTNSSFAQIQQLFIQRSVITTWLHATFTGLIAYGARYAHKHQKQRPLVWTVTIGVVLHRLFNSYIGQANLLWLIIIIILNYGTLSYIVTQSESIYLDKNGYHKQQPIDKKQSKKTLK